MATFSPIPQGGSQGALFVTSLATGTEQIRPGTNSVFIGATVTGDLTLVLPRANLYAAGTSIKVYNTLAITGRVLLAPRTIDNNTVNGLTAGIVALSSVGGSEAFSDGVSKWSVPNAAGLPGVITAAGTVGDGVTNDAPAIQAALAAAPAGSTVYLDPTRRYAILPGVIQVPDFVTLDCGRRALSNRQTRNLGPGQPPASPTASGQFVLMSGTNGTDTDPAYITLTGVNSALIGAVAYDPDQLVTLSAPIPKPFFIRTPNYGATVIGTELINPARGIDVRGARTLVLHTSGNPLMVGIRVDGGLDRPKIIDTHFELTYTGSDTPLYTWVQANGIAHIVGCTDEIEAYELFCFDYNIGLKLVAGNPIAGHVAGSYGRIEGNFDNCNFPVWDETTQETGVHLIVGFTGASGAGNAAYWAVSADAPTNRPAKTGRTFIDPGSRFWSVCPTYARISSGYVEIDGAKFGPNIPVNHIVNDAAATVRITNNSFLLAASGAADILINSGSFGLVGYNTAGATVAAARVTNNSTNVRVVSN